MRLQILEVYWDLGYIGFAILDAGWCGRSLLALCFMTEDVDDGAWLRGSVLWRNFSIGGKKKDTILNSE
jgi:hypothetical protein